MKIRCSFGSVSERKLLQFLSINFVLTLFIRFEVQTVQSQCKKKLFLELFIGRWTYFQTIVFKKKERRTLFFNEIHWLTLASENTLEVPRLHTQIIDVFFIWKLHAQNFLCWPQWWLLTHSECVRINKLFF